MKTANNYGGGMGRHGRPRSGHAELCRGHADGRAQSCASAANSQLANASSAHSPVVCTLYTMPVAATGVSGWGSRPAKRRGAAREATAVMPLQAWNGMPHEGLWQEEGSSAMQPTCQESQDVVRPLHCSSRGRIRLVKPRNGLSIHMYRNRRPHAQHSAFM